MQHHAHKLVDLRPEQTSQASSFANSNSSPSPAAAHSASTGRAGRPMGRSFCSESAQEQSATALRVRRCARPKGGNEGNDCPEAKQRAATTEGTAHEAEPNGQVPADDSEHNWR